MGPKIISVFWRDTREEINVFVRVEGCHLEFGGTARALEVIVNILAHCLTRISICL